VGLTFKSDKIALFYSVSYFNLGAWCSVWGAKPTKAPRGDGTGSTVGSLKKTLPYRILQMPKG